MSKLAHSSDMTDQPDAFDEPQEPRRGPVAYSPWEQDASEFVALDPCGTPLDSFLSRAEAEAYAKATFDAVDIEERQTRRRLIWSAFAGEGQ